MSALPKTLLNESRGRASHTSDTRRSQKIRRPIAVKLGPEARSYQRTKRVIDLAISILIFPPVLLLVAICYVAIRLESPGPAFFYQWRTGKGGKRFRMIKLRTMFANAEELKQKYKHLNELTWPDFKITNDPRVTRVGRFLRKSSLDELPQIMNVIRGDMSLVGPRPTSFAVETYELIHTERLEVVPGITGLWQISGRSDVDFNDRVTMDIEYIERRSTAYDMWIMYRTITAVLFGKGAY